MIVQNRHNNKIIGEFVIKPDANLRRANLREADLRGTQLPDSLKIAKGKLIGYKKAGEVIVTIEVPVKAKRSKATTNKMRCAFAKVIDIDTNHVKMVISDYDANVVYRIGEMVYPDSFDDNRWNECSNGIHFFLTKEDAENY